MYIIFILYLDYRQDDDEYSQNFTDCEIYIPLRPLVATLLHLGTTAQDLLVIAISYNNRILGIESKNNKTNILTSSYVAS